MSDLNERDLKQRTLGTISFSLIAHAGLLAVLVFSPHPSAKEASGLDGAGGSPGSGSDVVYSETQEMNTESGTTTPVEVVQQADVVVAAANDPEAVSIPEATPAPTPNPTPAATPVSTPVPKPAPKPKKIAVAKPKVAKAITQPEVTQETPKEIIEDDASSVPKLNPVIENPKEEQAELAAAAAADEEPKLNESPEETQSEAAEEKAEPIQEAAPAPAPKQKVVSTIPVKNIAKKDERAQEAPKPIVAASGDEDEDEGSASERSGAVVAAPTASGPGLGKGPSQGSGSSKVEGTGAGVTKTGLAGIPAGAEIKDADKMTLLSTKPFTYPQADRLANRSGTAFVVAKVNADGSIADVVLEKSSGSKTMDQEAVKTFKQWKFSPGQEGFVRKPVQFVLKGDVQETKAKLTR